MTAQEIYKGLTITAELFPEVGSYEWSVQGMISPEEYFEFATKVEGLLTRYPCRVSLFDQRTAFRFPFSLHMHVSTDLVPKLIVSGLHRIAIVPSTMYDSRHALEETMTLLHQLNVEMRLFDDVATARAWLYASALAPVGA